MKDSVPRNAAAESTQKMLKAKLKNWKNWFSASARSTELLHAQLNTVGAVVRKVLSARTRVH